MKMQHELVIDEGQRQLVLMALAHLAVERPGFDYALAELAKKMDTVVGDRPELYDRFREMISSTGLIPE